MHWSYEKNNRLTTLPLIAVSINAHDSSRDSSNTWFPSGDTSSSRASVALVGINPMRTDRWNCLRLVIWTNGRVSKKVVNPAAWMSGEYGAPFPIVASKLEKLAVPLGAVCSVAFGSVLRVTRILQLPNALPRKSVLVLPSVRLKFFIQ